MKPRLPFKLKFLLISSHLVCALALLECSLILWGSIQYPSSNIMPTVINMALFAIFLAFSVLLIRIIKTYYPAAEIPRGSKIIFRIAAIGAWICIGFFFVAIIALFADSRLNPNFQLIFSNPFTAALFLSFLGCFVLQVFNSILATGIIRRINKNHRKQMFESI